MFYRRNRVLPHFNTRQTWRVSWFSCGTILVSISLQTKCAASKNPTRQCQLVTWHSAKGLSGPKHGWLYKLPVICFQNSIKSVHIFRTAKCVIYIKTVSCSIRFERSINKVPSRTPTLQKSEEHLSFILVKQVMSDDSHADTDKMSTNIYLLMFSCNVYKSKPMRLWRNTQDLKYVAVPQPVSVKTFPAVCQSVYILYCRDASSLQVNILTFRQKIFTKSCIMWRRIHFRPCLHHIKRTVLHEMNFLHVETVAEWTK